MVHDKVLAQEITQEAFYRLCCRPYLLQDLTNIKGWIRTVAYNMALDHTRRMEQRYRKDFVRLEWIDWIDDHARYEQTFYDGPPPGERVRAAINKLPAKYRLAVYYKYYLDMSVREIAISMGTTVPAIKSFLFRAYNKLAALLTEQDAIYQGKITRRKQLLCATGATGENNALSTS